MASDNHVSISGRLFGPNPDTDGPDLRYSASGNAFAKFALALYGGKNEDGSFKDSHFVDVICFGDMAEAVASNLTSGDRLSVVGRIQQNRWETDDGQKRSKLEVIADEVGPSYKWGDSNSVSDTTPKQSSRPKAPAPQVDDDDLF